MTAAEVLRKSVFGGWIFLCLFLVNLAGGRVTPRISSLARQTIFSEPTKPIPGPEKNYTGIRVNHDSLLVLYHHEQTVAIVEVAPNRILFNCELLEARTTEDQRVTLSILKPLVPTQMKIAFSDMVDLMAQCQKLDPPLNLKRESPSERASNESQVDAKQFTSIFSGIFPGTKWCGTGDIAATYHDLGHEKELDKCCRTHDLCPVKVAGLRTQYGLTNYGLYTKSHCSCEDVFYDCLKSLGSRVSNFLGGLYFNVTPVTCVDDDEVDNKKKRFVTKHRRY